ncbi:MAG: hypothetical protein ACYC3K_04650 [Candidatus Nanopelagicales bacterium]
MTSSAADEFHVAVHGQLMREVVAFAVWYLISGLAASAAWLYGGAEVHSSAASLARDRGDRLRSAFAIDREASRGIHDIENYLARRDTPA